MTTVIVDAVRSPIGKFNKSLKDLEVGKMAGQTFQALVERNSGIEKYINEIMLGVVYQAGAKANPARQAGIFGGLSKSIPSMTINQQCASGMRAITLGNDLISAGSADFIIAGGAENMSRVPYVLTNARNGYRLGDGHIYDSLFYDGFTDPFVNYHMGRTAENVAEMYNINKEEQNAFSLESHRKAVEAIEKGKFKNEIIPLQISDANTFDEDEIPRRDTSLEKLNGLPSVFIKDGTVTAGNSSAIADGSAAVILTSSEKAESLNLKKRAVIKSYGMTALDPSIMGLGPIEAIRNALKSANLSIDDIEIFEINEAFAAQSLAVIKELSIDRNLVNVNGGAIALGHPVGSSGSRIVVTLLHEMERRDLRYGIASLCVGGGQGLAILLERN